jgi:hypothetical protein
MRDCLHDGHLEEDRHAILLNGESPFGGRTEIVVFVGRIKIKIRIKKGIS